MIAACLLTVQCIFTVRSLDLHKELTVYLLRVPNVYVVHSLHVQYCSVFTVFRKRPCRRGENHDPSVPEPVHFSFNSATSGACAEGWSAPGAVGFDEKCWEASHYDTIAVTSPKDPPPPYTPCEGIYEKLKSVERAGARESNPYVTHVGLASDAPDSSGVTEQPQEQFSPTNVDEASDQTDQLSQQPHDVSNEHNAHAVRGAGYDNPMYDMAAGPDNE